MKSMLLMMAAVAAVLFTPGLTTEADALYARACVWQGWDGGALACANSDGQNPDDDCLLDIYNSPLRGHWVCAEAGTGSG